MSDRILVGIASIPERQHALEQVIDTLAPQADTVAVSLNGYAKKPAFLRKHRNVKATMRGNGNGGDAEKFASVDDWDGYVITCDDDVLYPADYVETAIAGVDRYKRAALVSFHGGNTLGYNGDPKAANLRSFRCLGTVAHDHDDVNVLGTGTLAYHTGRVPVWRDVFRSANMADVHLACHARTLGIPMVVLEHEQGWLQDICPGPGIYEANKHGDGTSRDTRTQRKAELDRHDWETTPPGRPLVRVSIATCNRPAFLAALLEDLEREARYVNLEVCVYEDPTDVDYTEAHAICERHGWDWVRFEMRLGRQAHWQLVDQELADCRFSRADWFVFLPDDIRLVRHAIPKAITTWQRLSDPSTLTLWRLKDHEGQTNWTGKLPVDRGEAWEVFHVDGIYLCQRDTLKFLRFCCPRPSPRARRRTSSGVGRAMSLALHNAGFRMYRVDKSLAVPVPVAQCPSVMNPFANDRVYAGICL